MKSWPSLLLFPFSARSSGNSTCKIFNIKYINRLIGISFSSFIYNFFVVIIGRPKARSKLLKSILNHLPYILSKIGIWNLHPNDEVKLWCDLILVGSSFNDIVWWCLLICWSVKVDWNSWCYGFARIVHDKSINLFNHCDQKYRKINNITAFLMFHCVFVKNWVSSWKHQRFCSWIGLYFLR